MSPNHQLTDAVKGRRVAGSECGGGTLTVHFKDGTTLHIQGTPEGLGATPGPETGTGPVPEDAVVTQVFQQPNRLALHFEDRTSLVVTLTRTPDGPVSVQDSGNKVLYAG